MAVEIGLLLLQTLHEQIEELQSLGHLQFVELETAGLYCLDE